MHQNDIAVFRLADDMRRDRIAVRPPPVLGIDRPQHDRQFGADSLPQDLRIIDSAGWAQERRLNTGRLLNAALGL